MEILDTTPDHGDEGIALQSTISVTFDEEVDPDSVIASGNFVIATSAFKLSKTGPGAENLEPDNDDLLTSEVFTGFLKGTIATEDNLTFVFTPTTVLESDRLYRAILSTSIVSRTISNVAPDVGNTSTGSFITKGPYTGIVDDTITIEVTGGGVLGIATFTYHKASTGLTSEDIVTDRLVDLDSGIKLAFKAGTFVLGDTWVFDTTVPVPLDDIYEFSFTTGSISHVEVSVDTPSFQLRERELEGLRRIDGVPAVDSGTLGLVSIFPENQESNVSLSQKTIRIEFNKPIDPDSLDDATIKVLMENLPLDENEQYSYELRVSTSVSGNILTLTFNG